MTWEKRNFLQTDKRRLTLAVFLDSLCVLVSSLILELAGPSSILGAFKGHSLDWFLDIIPIPRPCCQWPTGFPTASWEGFEYLFVMLFITIHGNAIIETFYTSFYLTCEVSLPDEDNALQKQFVE